MAKKKEPKTYPQLEKALKAISNMDKTDKDIFETVGSVLNKLHDTLTSENKAQFTNSSKELKEGLSELTTAVDGLKYKNNKVFEEAIDPEDVTKEKLQKDISELIEINKGLGDNYLDLLNKYEECQEKLKLEKGQLSSEEEDKLLIEKSNLEKDLQSALDNFKAFKNKFDTLEIANKELNSKIEEKTAKYTKELNDLKKEYEKADAESKERINELILQKSNLEGKLWVETTTHKNEKSDLLKRIGIFETPNHFDKVENAILTLQNIDSRVGDFYDDLAYTIIVFNELLHAKTLYDYKDYKKIVRKSLKAAWKKARKLKLDTIKKLN